MRPRTRCAPLSRLRGRDREGACNKIHLCKLTLSPTLPRKRGREQTEFAACADSISHECGLGSPWPNPLERSLHRLVRNPRTRPAVEPAVHEPDHQNAEHAAEHYVAEEVRAGRHAQHAHGGAEGERAAIGERAPLRRHYRGARHRPERARRLAGDEGAILRTIAARIPPRTEMFVAAELDRVHTARHAT